MRFDMLVIQPDRSGPLQRLDARVTLIFALAYILTVVALPLTWWRALMTAALALAFVLGLAGLSPGTVFRRWFALMLVVGFVAAMVAVSHPQRPDLGFTAVFLAVITKNLLAFLTIMTLSAVVPLPKLLQALRKLGMPLVLISSLQFMWRYLALLLDELERMSHARRARSFRPSGRLDWRLLTNLIGVLFVRSVERGERVHSAMLARGWDGTIRLLDEECDENDDHPINGDVASAGPDDSVSLRSRPNGEANPRNDQVADRSATLTGGAGNRRDCGSGFGSECIYAHDHDGVGAHVHTHKYECGRVYQCGVVGGASGQSSETAADREAVADYPARAATAVPPNVAPHNA